MGLSGRESGFGAARADFCAEEREKRGKGRTVVALAGVPNVGKSTLFNALTGLNQHTGNWAGKTVKCAEGCFKTERGEYLLVDIPGTYSMYASSKEEEVASDFIAYGGADVTVVVCDATSLERSLGLVISVMEICPRVLVAVNLIDEARRRGIEIDLKALSELLGLECVGVVAKRKKTFAAFYEALDQVTKSEGERKRLKINPAVDSAVEKLAEAICSAGEKQGVEEYVAARMLSGAKLGKECLRFLGLDPTRDEKIREEFEKQCKLLLAYGIDFAAAADLISRAHLEKSCKICQRVRKSENKKGQKMSPLDRILTGRVFAFPFMLLMLFLVLFITVSLANYPSELLSQLFFYLGNAIRRAFLYFNSPAWLVGALVDGVYTVLAEVVSVMLPPMAIFFPLFTLLEDMGYLPRVAYNLDRPFRCVGACGKQSLTMCMGLGCNAAGIVGCRIIDSPRERALAIVTNALVPCNGRFPTVILIVGAFFTAGYGALSGVYSALILALVVVVGVISTFALTFILSKTFYKGEASFFTIEMPPFRKPDTVRVLVRSFLDRTLHVLLRAVAVAAPAGLVIWILSTVTLGDVSLLNHFSSALDPIGRFLGMDGVILAAFILALPANEIVLPLAIVGYSQLGIGEALGTEGVVSLLAANGWTRVTAICVIIFSLMHWPCSTSIITVWKETRSIKTTLLSVLAPTAMGVICCALFNLIAA